MIKLKPNQFVILPDNDYGMFLYLCDISPEKIDTGTPIYQYSARMKFIKIINNKMIDFLVEDVVDEFLMMSLSLFESLGVTDVTYEANCDDERSDYIFDQLIQKFNDAKLFL